MVIRLGKVVIIVLAIFCGLYAPFELTRILLLLKSGYRVAVPWYLVYEIIAVWLGWLMMIIAVRRIK